MSKKPGTAPEDAVPVSRNTVIRLLIIPVLIYIIWMIECFLFGSTEHFIIAPAGPAIFLYTLVPCILTGLVIPVFLIQRAFVSGSVTMFQFGFRSLRRTILVVIITFLVLCICIFLFDPAMRAGFMQNFLFLLPTGIATAMICWVLVGTHVQALVRSGGAALSIPVGIMVTSILFIPVALVLAPMERSPDLITLYFGVGILMALFFFAVRDIYAAGIAVTGCLVFLFSGSINPAEIASVLPWVYGAAIMTTGVLAGIHWYLSRRFVTIPVPCA